MRGIRERKSTLARSGIEIEELGPDEQPLTRTVTRERYDRLNSIGFQVRSRFCTWPLGLLRFSRCVCVPNVKLEQKSRNE